MIMMFSLLRSGRHSPLKGTFGNQRAWLWLLPVMLAGLQGTAASAGSLLALSEIIRGCYSSLLQNKAGGRSGEQGW